MIGNGYQLTKAFYAELATNEEMQIKAKPHHVSLYVWICELRNRVKMDVVDLPREYTMKMTLIGSPVMLKACIEDLARWDIIEILAKGTAWGGATKVRLSCSYLNRNCTATEQQSYSNSTAGEQPSNITKRNKTDKTSKPEKQGLFDLFWDQYGKKTGSKPKACQEWEKLSDFDQQLAIDAIDRYKAYEPDGKYRKDPERYIKYRLWESEFDLPDRPVERVHINGHSLAPTPKPVFSDR